MEKILVRSYWRLSYILLYIFVVAVFGGFGLIAASKPGATVFIGIFCTAFSLLFPAWFIGKSPLITITTKRIKLRTFFKREEILLSEIKSIGLLRKSMLTFFGFSGEPVESSSVMTNDFKEVIFFDAHYQNSHKIKWILSQIQREIRSKESNFQSIQVDRPRRKDVNALHLRHLAYRDFSDNWLTSFRGLTLVSIFPFLIYINANGNKKVSFYFDIGAFVFWWTFLGYQLYYYRVSDQYLTIRNHAWPWVNRTYALSDIKQVVLDSAGKLPNGIRVITNDFRYRVYPGGSLRDKTFKELIGELTKRGVDVRNHLFLD